MRCVHLCAACVSFLFPIMTQAAVFQVDYSISITDISSFEDRDGDGQNDIFGVNKNEIQNLTARFVIDTSRPGTVRANQGDQFIQSNGGVQTLDDTFVGYTASQVISASASFGNQTFFKEDFFDLTPLPGLSTAVVFFSDNLSAQYDSNKIWAYVRDNSGSAAHIGGVGSNFFNSGQDLSIFFVLVGLIEEVDPNAGESRIGSAFGGSGQTVIVTQLQAIPAPAAGILMGSGLLGLLGIGGLGSGRFSLPTNRKPHSKSR